MFPWSSTDANENLYPKANLSSLNVHAPAFEVYPTQPIQPNYTPSIIDQQPPTVTYANGSYIQSVPLSNDTAYYSGASGPIRTIHHTYTNGQVPIMDPRVMHSQPTKTFNGEYYQPTTTHVAAAPKPMKSFNLNPYVKPFMPSNLENIRQPSSNGTQKQGEFRGNVYSSNVAVKENFAQRDVSTEKEPSSCVLQSNVSNVKEPSSYVVNDSSKNNVVVTSCENINRVQATNVSQPQEDVKKASVVAKPPEENVIKVSESSLSKVSENKVLKVSENVSNVGNDRKSPVNMTPKTTNGPMQLQKSAIEKSAEEVTVNGVKQRLETEKTVPVPVKKDPVEKTATPKPEPKNIVPVRRSWADIVSTGQKPTNKVSVAKSVGENEKESNKTVSSQDADADLVAEDNMALALGKHLFNLELNFQPVLLQPTGIINRRNWCYVNATLQALLACPPFYTLLRNLPLGPGVEREKSSTPVIDSMVKVAYEYSQFDKPQEELKVGEAFQPDFIYSMLKELKSDCLKGQQEDAEEFLSFILNGMHEEMVKIIKNYEKKNHIDLEVETKENGGISDGEDEWQVIGSKHKGMVTRKVAEHKTPISDLLGGQIKSFLTTSGSKTSASIQPFFTLQLDVQSENVTSVSEALKEMTNKEPIQGYTCAKTKQEVEAFSHIALQKLPPILILHLKRFVYNKNGGCKKVMKKTDYPIMLEISRDLFSPDVKKSQRLRQYKLFAVMYHDGEEAVKGHYISDVYNHGSQSWIRCDDRTITAVTEEQVLSYSPPRVPYLLFYHQES
ncbi:hypothetical protein JTE90_019981 [Oedothorax gibbosus]|uniref:ubiquitinyl hydrolase 1 n=1 Tax=Oedothorax gibbosus TaxID=931172 RepID=A0AAV6UFA8_9ARAC|nr:hypothetical protein JTE90_019981 [Oedothorax gibbosus]